MQAPPRLREHRPVGRFLDQRVLEAVLRLRPAAALADQVESLELVEGRPDVAVAAEHAFEERQAEPAAERRGRGEHLVGLCRQAVDPREQDLLDRRRNLDLDRVVESPAPVLVGERARVGERSDQLLEVEGIPFRLLEQAALQLLRQRLLADECQQELPRAIARRRFERELARQMRVFARRELAQTPRRMVALASLGDHEQDRGLLTDREQPLGELNRGRIGPVEVLEDDRDGPVLGEPAEDLLDNFESPVLQRLRRQLGEASGSVRFERQTEQRAQIWIKLRRAVREERFDAAPKGDSDPQLRLVVADAEPLAQQVAKRPVRERFAVGDAAALEPQGRRRGGRLRNLEDAVQLVQQPALADARLARDEEKAARAAQRTFERKLGQVELPLSADEARLDPFEPTDLLPLREHTL